MLVMVGRSIKILLLYLTSLTVSAENCGSKITVSGTNKFVMLLNQKPVAPRIDFHPEIHRLHVLSVIW